MKERFQVAAKRRDHEENEFYTITAKMMRTVYAEVMCNLGLANHEKIVTLQELNGIDLGYHHYERTSARRMIETISHVMH